MISGRRGDRGSITPIMMVVVASTVMAMSLTARLGRDVAHASQLDAVAGAVALALATGDREVGVLVAAANGVRIVDVRILGDSVTGFDATVTVADTGGHGRARASTRIAPTIPVSGASVLR